jgi:probable HAF family extracellular repeat protein
MARANRLALCLIVVFFLAAFAAAQSYTITDLGPGQAFAINSLGDVAIGNGNSFVWSPGGSILNLLPLIAGSATSPSGINGQGLAVGASGYLNETSAVLWTNGAPLDLGTLGGKGSAATGINASGEVAGYSTLPSGVTEAFVWSEATGMQGLGFFSGGDLSYAEAINRFGHVVGYSTGNAGNYGFIWSKTTGMKSLGKFAGGVTSGASAINDLGQVAGYADCGNGCGHAVLWSKAKGSMLDLGVLPGSISSYARGINNVGQVVGLSYYSPVGNHLHAFVWSPSTGMLDLNNLIPANSGWLLQSANAINDQGQIVGLGMLNGQNEAFLLTPQ